MYPHITDIFNPELIVRGVNDAVRCGKLHIADGRVKIGPKPPVEPPKPYSLDQTREMIRKYAVEGKLTEWFGGGVTPTKSGVYNINHHYSPFSFYDVATNMWYRESQTVEQAHLSREAVLASDNCDPKERTKFVCYQWRAFKEQQT